MAALFKVNTEDLEVGMYISKLDRPWLDTPFLLQGFYIKNRSDIDIISDICDHVFVDTTATRQKMTSEMASVSSAMGLDNQDTIESGIAKFNAIPGKSESIDKAIKSKQANNNRGD